MIWKSYITKGKDNIVANVLLRKDEEVQTFAISMVILEWLNQIQSECAKNIEASSIINNLSQHPKFEWKNGIHWYKGRICLSPNSRFKTKFLQEFHESPAIGHVWFFKTYYNVCQSFFWKEMSGDIQKICSRV